MFPIPWNFPLRKKNGNLVNIGDAIDAGTEIPEHTSSDEGKLLSVDENGDLEWSDEVNSEIQTLTNNLSDEINNNANNGVKNQLIPNQNLVVNNHASESISVPVGTLVLDKIQSLVLSFEQVNAVSSIDRNTLLLHPASGSELYPTNVVSPTINAGYHEGVINNAPAGTYEVRIWSQKPDVEVDYTNFMIRDISITDTTYQPYAMTNRELTELATITSDTSTLFKYHKVNSIVTMQLVGQQTYADIKNLTIPVGFRPNSIVTVLGYCVSGTSRYLGVVNFNPNGAISIGKIVNDAFTTPSDTDSFEFSTCYYAGN